MKIVRVFERDKIFYGKGHELTEEQFNTLVKYNDQNDQKYFSVIHRGIRFSQYVGVVKVGNLLIEIAPKLDNTEASDSHGYWQKVLLDMLRECRILSPSAPTKADLRLKNNSLLDLYFELFVDEVEYLYRRGLIKRYVSKSENAKAVKGRIEFTEHIRKNVIHKERFYVNYNNYSFNHLINQILLKTLNVIEDVSDDASLSGRISKLRFAMPELDDINVSGKLFERITFDRKNEKYRDAIQMAELLLLNYSPDITTGRNNLLALLFDMEQLFEEYVFRRLKKYARANDFSVLRQTSKKFWRSRTIRPDILLKKDGHTFVMDTKWKSLSKVHPSVDDLRQMFVYNQYFGSNLSVLIYPQSNNLNSDRELFREPSELFRFDGESIDHGCLIYFMPLITEDGLNYEASEQLVQNLFNN